MDLELGVAKVTSRSLTMKMRQRLGRELETFPESQRFRGMLGVTQKGRKDIHHSPVNLKSNAGERQWQCKIVCVLNNDKHN